MKFVSILLCALLLSCTSHKVKKKTILKVNGTEISVSQFAQELTERLQGTDTLIIRSTDILKMVKKQVIADYIQEIILIDFLKKEGDLVSDTELDAEIQKIRSKYPDDISFRASLADEGLSFQRWAEKTRRSMNMKRAVDKITSEVEHPSDQEIQDYYNKNRDSFRRNRQINVRQIVSATSSDAEKIRSMIKNDSDFENMAKEFSIGPEGPEGGDLGWIDEGTAEVFDEAAKLPLRTISQVIKSPFAYHIVQITGRRPARLNPLDEVRPHIFKTLLENKKQEKFNEWFEQAKQKVQVSIDEDLLQTMTIEVVND